MAPSDPSAGDASPDRAAAEESYRQARQDFARREREANERAIASFRAAVAHDPTFAPAQAGLAAAYCEAMIRYGQPRTLVDEAIALAEKSVVLDPALLAGHDALAFAYFAKGLLRESLAAQYRAYALDPTDPEMISNIAFLHLDLGELVESVEWSGRALGPDSPSAYERAFAHRNRGRLALIFGEDAVAEAWLRKAVALRPDFSSARVLLVYIYYLRGNNVRLQVEARALLAEKADDPETLNYAADVALLRGDLAEAGRLLERAIELGPDSRNFYRARRAKTALAYVLWKRGDREAARAHLEERAAARLQEYAQGLNAWGPPFELAAIHALQGQRPDAVAWLRRAVERGWREPHLAEIDVLLEGLPGDPEFEKILRDLRGQIAQLKARAGRIEPPP